MGKRTIAAISTPLGPGGIGIIRISGSDSLRILQTLFVAKTSRSKRNGQKNGSIAFLPRRLYHGYIKDVASRQLIDEVLVFYMKAPNSYTREDIVEIQSHSGYVVLERILSAVLDLGAVLAKPGEFTQIAFINGRIDLTQAEAVIDLINAPCETAATIAMQQASGGIKRKIDLIVERIAEFIGKCEAMIEFGESDQLEIEDSLAGIKDAVCSSLLNQITGLINSQKSKAIFCEGVLMAIAGVPNVGKSSLLNQLVEKETAIVSEFPGTTRDVIREYLSINGIPVVLCDTAGLHETQDPVECIGINKAHDHIDSAELLLFVVEATRRLNPFEEKFLADNKSKQVIVVINKSDITDTAASKEIKSKTEKHASISVSAKTGKGLDQLKNLIFETLIHGQKFELKSELTPNLRQRKILEKIEKMILSEKENADFHSPELMVDFLDRIRTLLEEITGKKTDNDMYDYIFSQFCVGK